LGLIGCGQVAQHCHLPALLGINGIEVFALSDIDPTILDRVANRFRVGRCYRDFRSMLGDREIDVVAVCTPPQFQTEIALSVLDANKHLFLEKPAALSMSDADRLLNAASKSHCRSIVGFNLRFHRLIREAKRIIYSGHLGRILIGRSSFTSNALRYSSWQNGQELGGDALFDLGIHHFDLWRFLLQSEVEEVLAHRRLDQVGAEYVAVNATMSDGVRVNAFFSHGGINTNEFELWGTKARLTLSCYRSDSLRIRCKVEPPGAIREWFDGVGSGLRNLPRAVKQVIQGGDMLMSYRSEWLHLEDSIRTGRPLSCGLEDAHKAIGVTLGAINSASLGQTVKVKLPNEVVSGSTENQSGQTSTR
jgi:predicted dehydrogenase